MWARTQKAFSCLSGMLGELQIAELVARGLTNAEIGTALWISQNSVKQALKRMFRKLNVSSRTEMVGQLHGILG